jgi:hypothetical protein
VSILSTHFGPFVLDIFHPYQRSQSVWNDQNSCTSWKMLLRNPMGYLTIMASALSSSSQVVHIACSCKAACWPRSWTRSSGHSMLHVNISQADDYSIIMLSCKAGITIYQRLLGLKNMDRHCHKSFVSSKSALCRFPILSSS